MSAYINPEYDRLCDMVRPYEVYEKGKGFYIPEDAPKEIHEAYKKKDEMYKEMYKETFGNYYEK